MTPSPTMPTEWIRRLPWKMENVRIVGLWVRSGDDGAGEIMRPGFLYANGRSNGYVADLQMASCAYLP